MNGKGITGNCFHSSFDKLRMNGSSCGIMGCFIFVDRLNYFFMDLFGKQQG